MTQPGSGAPRGGTPPIGPGTGRGPMGGGGPMAAGMMVREKPKSFKKTMRTFLKYLKPYRLSLAVVFIFAIGSTGFMIVGPKMQMWAVDRLTQGVLAKLKHVPGAAIDFHYIGTIVIILAGLYLISSLFNYAQGFIMSNIAMKITYQLRKNIAEKIKRLPMKYFDRKTHGEIQSHVTNDIDTINTTITQNLTQIVTSVTTLIGVFIMMLTISWIMTLVVLLLPLSFVLVSRVIKASQKYFQEQQAYLGHVNGHVEEMYSGHVVMKAFNGEEKSIQEFDKLNEVLYGSVWKSQFLSSLMMPIMNTVSNLSFVTVSFLGGYLAVRGALSIGGILAFIRYVQSFGQPVAQLATIANVLQSTAAAAERVFEFLDEEEEVPEPSNAVKLEKVAGRVSFKDVRFGYSKDKIIIRDFSADIKPGQMVAIVGPTGAGKTTIVKLLMRFYDVDNGSISVDGVDIRKMTRNNLRNMFGMVLQDAWLFNGTIKDNIRYGNLEATDSEVTDAAKMAYVDHFVHTLPQGYDMELNEETSNISQGQKQLLTIARAFLADPPILILDEATSSVDTRTEILIQTAMKELLKNRTSFVIAHRLSTIRSADMILVMDKGDIVEQGTHEELLASGGFYATLYQSQFETTLPENGLALPPQNLTV